MIKELRLYWRLRPHISQLKGLLAMKFSTHLLVQIVIVLTGALVDVFDLLPPNMQKPVLIGCTMVSAILGVIHQFYNPDGTTAALPWEKKLDSIKKKNGILPLVCLLVLVPGLVAIPAAHAQGLPEQGISMVIGVNQYADFPIQGSGTYFKLLAGPVYALSTFDVTAIPGTEGQLFNALPKLQFSYRPGLWLPLIHLGNLHLGPLGEAGLATTGNTTGGSFGAGGLAVWKFRENWGIVGAVRFVKNNVTGVQTIPEFGIAYGR